MNKTKTTTTVTANSATTNSNKQTTIISSHCSKVVMSSNKMEDRHCGIMMNDNDSNRGEGEGEGERKMNIDEDLEGIPSFILKLQETQPTLNIMTCGDVSHGKSTLLKALSGEKTGKDSREIKGNMTIRLGYTSCKIWKCLICPKPKCYFSTHSDLLHKKICCNNCGSKYTDNKILLIRHLSFVDVPGHSDLMQTMVSATCVADAAILVIDSSAKICPGKQTEQHCSAINLLGLMKKNQIIIAQNKIDLVDHSMACLNYEKIRNYLSTFNNDVAYCSPVIPISAQSKLNIDALCHSIINHLPKYSKRLTEGNDLMKNNLYINIIRSFDVNRAKDLRTNDDIDRISGGVIGGAVLNGHLAVGQLIEIRPGYIKKKKLKKYKNKLQNKLQPKWQVQPIITRVVSLKYGKHPSHVAYPGGNVGIQTNIDPSLTKSDRMTGHIVIDATADKQMAPPIFSKFIMSYCFLQSEYKQKQFKTFEQIRVNIGAFKMKAEIIRRETEKYNAILVSLEAPICASIGDEVGICRSGKQQQWAFVGGGIIRKVCRIQCQTDAKRLTNLTSSTVKPVIGSAATQMNGISINNATIVINKENNISVSNNKTKVHLNYQQRNGKKGITTIVGLPIDLNFEKILNKMKKKWSTGGTIMKDESAGNVIQLNGDLRDVVKTFLVEYQIVEKSQITRHGY